MTFSDPNLDSSTIQRPDHILDVTEVAECIVGVHDLPQLALLRRLSPRRPNSAAVRGTLVNAAFDLMVADPDITDDDIVHQLLILRPLALAAVGTAVDVPSLRILFPRLRDVLLQWKPQNILVEPHVVSRTWGLQGRFDILVTTEHGIDLIEMKSGNAPSGTPRANHIAQVAAYALLYAELERVPLSSVRIWYVADEKHPFRSLSHELIHAMQHRVLTTRNRIVDVEQSLSKRDFAPLRMFTGTAFAAGGPSAEFEHAFSNAYRNADVVSRTLAQAWISFLMREQFASRENGGRPLGQLTGVQLDVDLSDLNRKHLTLLTREPISDTSLRIGDQVVLIPHARTTNTLLVKASIRSLHHNSVGVTLRNKQADLEDIRLWDVIQDLSDSSIRNLYPGVVEFLQQSEQRRNVLTGVSKPLVSQRVRVQNDSLFPDQLDTIERALGARDLFFIQGPPGTGKTSSILRSLVSQLVQDPNERILIVAYTNRAVAEICDVLARESVDSIPVQFLRHGSKDGMLTSRSGEHGIPFIAAHMSPAELGEKVRNSNCIVSTIHGMHSSPEILSFGEFTTLIVDEASQVLEPHIIGLLSHTNRAILIGDQCQLPAVVSQATDLLSVTTEILSPLNVTNLSSSYFDRMVSVYKRNGWDEALAMLESQGRMHADVMQFPSEEFYGGRLKPMHPWQTSSKPLPWHKMLPKRSIFVDVSDQEENQNLAEAKTLVALAEAIHAAGLAVGEEHSIGIITPFRSQNTLVMSLLSNTLSNIATVDTVERFQGSQRDVILYGTIVSNEQEFQSIRSETELSGVRVDRKLNVACTRARHQFVLVGKASVLGASPSYAKFIAMAQK